MLLITITHAKEKFYMLLKIFLLLLLLGLIVPNLYVVLSEAGSLHRWAEKKEVLPQEPMRVEQSQEEGETSFWEHIVNSLK